jgi:hypothetical protein
LMVVETNYYFLLLNLHQIEKQMDQLFEMDQHQ